MAGQPFENTFHKGVAISVWQNSSDEHSQWTQYSRRKVMGFRACQGSDMDDSCDFWNRYEEDIGLAHELGCNSFRLSIEWARIEPQKGVVDQDAVDRYNRMLDCLERLGMEVNATLHHFVHPKWFDDIGGFTVEKNIPLFVDWTRLAYKLFGGRIRMWATFNEPSCTTFLGWIAGMHPPGKIMRFGEAGYVLLHMLQAHVKAYRAIKEMPGGEKAFVGLVHHHIMFRSKAKYFAAHAKSAANWLEYWWAWDVVEDFMKTGHFEWQVPVLGTWIQYQDPHGRPPCDWWGINFYSRVVLTRWLSPGCMPGEIMTDMFYPIYPDGMYDTIKRMSTLGLPMYITENGISDAKDDRRSIWIDGYFKATLRAIRDGYDVRGFYYWSLTDNFEWNMGFTMKFGLYSWEHQSKDPHGVHDRKLKEGAKPLMVFYKTLPETLPELRMAAEQMLGSREEEERGKAIKAVPTTAKTSGLLAMIRKTMAGRKAKEETERERMVRAHAD